MPCETCGHTLAVLCLHEGAQYTHCERCGTVVVVERPGDSHPERRVYRPKLVDRCREFARQLEPIPDGLYRTLWRMLSVEESIRLPEDRP